MRRFLASRLPEYMVPAKFVGIDALPLTINGKLDTSALPRPTTANLIAGQVVTRPDTPDGSIEGQVVEMVRDILKLPSVAPADDIFLLGGHSMLAMQLVARIRHVSG